MTIDSQRPRDNSDGRPIMRIIPDDARHPEFRAAMNAQSHERIPDPVTRKLAIRYVKPGSDPQPDQLR